MFINQKRYILHTITIVTLLLIIAVTAIAVRSVEQSNRLEVTKSLRLAIDSAQQGVHLVYQGQLAPTLVWANDLRIRKDTKALLEVARDPAALQAVPEQRNLRTLLNPYLKLAGFKGFFIIDKDGTSLASSRNENLGTPNLLKAQLGFLEQVWAGQALVSLPARSDVPLRDSHGHLTEALSSMFAAAPVRDENGQVIAILTLRIDPHQAFDGIFSRSRFGATGETYALSQAGLFLSESRFTKQLFEIGLLDNDDHSDLVLEVRDPGVNISLGERPALSRQQQPLTRMAESVNRLESGIDLSGYRDYRGVPVVGAWVWDDKLGFGIATEIDKSEAFEPMWQSLLIIGLFSFTLILAVGSMWGLFVANRRETIRNMKSALAQREAAEAARAEAAAANTAKSEFLSSMSHELRTPLNSILGFSQLLQSSPDEPLSEDQQESISYIARNGRHLLELINDILDLSKIEAGKIDVSTEVILPTDVIDECISFVTSFAMDRGISISAPERDKATPKIFADRTRFRQVMLNLLTNAVKYNKENGSITVTFSETGQDMLRVSVTDTGNGISDHDQGELFQAFNRLGAENTDIEGTGIGLVVSKNLAELMGGSVGLVSEVGTGSTFWLELPLSEPHHFEAAAIDVDADALVKAEGLYSDINGTLLYVEDNPSNLILMEKIVARIDGLTMITAQNAELGIELAKAKNPDLIIMDINLPSMNGIQALKILQRDDVTMNIPVIALSAAATMKGIRAGKEAGFSEYLTKPIDIPVVLRIIRETLKG